MEGYESALSELSVEIQVVRETSLFLLNLFPSCIIIQQLGTKFIIIYHKVAIH